MPTALQLGPERWKQYMKQDTVKQESKVDQSEYHLLMAQVQSAASKIRTELKATRVILIGSLAHQQWWDNKSDVDIVVEGLASDQYWKAWKIAEEFIEGREVEVIDYESATPRLQETIEREGLSL